jgi:hypothetical protein
MPLPQPEANEARDTFVARCLDSQASKEMEGTPEQKVAACEASYDEAKKSTRREIGTKAASAVTLGDEAKGEVVAHFATLDEVDNDGEVFPAGAIPDGMKVTVSSYNHDTVMGQMLGTGVPDQPPVGKGAIRIEGKRAIAYVNYFMETQRGREAYLTVKAMGADQAWSFAFHKEQVDPPSAEWKAKGARLMLTRVGPLLDGAMEVSPVKQPGGKRTGTLAVKQAETSVPEPEQQTVEVDPGLEHRLARVKRQIAR